MSRVEACTEYDGGHFEHFLQMYTFIYKSQIKCVRSHIDIAAFSCFRMWNSCPKFFLTFHLHCV
jgi:hypothetical protein